MSEPRIGSPLASAILVNSRPAAPRPRAPDGGLITGPIELTYIKPCRAQLRHI